MLALVCAGAQVLAQCHTGGPTYGYGYMEPGPANGYGTNWMTPLRSCVQFGAPARQHAYHIGYAAWTRTHGLLQCRSQLRQAISGMGTAYQRFQGSLTGSQIPEWYDHLQVMHEQRQRVQAAWRTLESESSKSRPDRLRVRRYADHLRLTVREWEHYMNSLLPS